MRSPFRAAIVTCATLLSATASTGAQQSQATRRDPVVHDISGFNVVLVVGETQKGPSSVTEDLPAGARKALADMREFLPYKHFRVLDAQWTSCCSPKPVTTVSGRLQGTIDVPGPNDKPVPVSRSYGFSISASVSTANIPVRFILSLEEPGSRRSGQGTSREIERERQDLQAEIETLEAQIRDMQKRVDIGTAPALEVRPLQDRHASLQRRLTDLAADAQSASHGGRAIIDSSFTMDAGETVVVGTSKLGGDKALIATVTAVRKK